MGGAGDRRSARATILAARLKERIARDGPLKVSDYMEACLSDSGAGYYTSRQPIGEAGDFITAPEVSQIFGELIGLWAVAVWQTMAEPKPIVVAELGPGRGTLMEDALRAWRSAPRFLDSVSIGLIETSPVLHEVQQSALHGSPAPVMWYRGLDEVPDGPLILLANEFIDALPIRQLVHREGAWRERRVVIDDKGGFAFSVGEKLSGLDLDAPDDAILEIRPAVRPLLSSLARRADQSPVAALIIDYGHVESGLGDTLQAVSRHRFADPLARPGDIDLTAHVDFAALKDTALGVGLTVCGPLPQGEFLLKLGLEARRDRLLETAKPEQRDSILSGATRLIDPQQMGLLFKVLVLTSNGLASPPPFGET